MNRDNEYEVITGIIENKLKDNENILVKQLFNSSELKYFDEVKVKSLVKHLIRTGKLSVVNKDGRRFRDYLIKWNPDVAYHLPKLKKSKFEDVRICVTLPPFNVHGLTDFLGKKRVEINSLEEEFKKLFFSAKKSIKICSPFIESKGFHTFQKVLLTKAKKKVEIQILSREINIEKNKRKFEDIRNIYNIFKKFDLEEHLDIRNYYFQTERKRLASSIHAKLIVIDNNKAYVGSGEIRENSFKKNLEIGLILSGDKVQELALIFDNIFLKSEVIEFD